MAGLNEKMRIFPSIKSRGDREEAFGGVGQSWKGCFVGGRYLVLGATAGEPGEKLYGNFPDHSRMPEELSVRALTATQK